MLFFQLFLSFLQVGLFSVGGGYAAIPLIERQIVGHYAWITVQEFSDLVTIAEMTPGPIAINAAAFVGFRIAGVPGVLIATLGCITPSLLIVSALYTIYNRYKSVSAFQNVLGCLRPAVVALIASAGLTILLQAIFQGQAPALTHLSYVKLLLFAGAFLLLRKTKGSPILIMLGCGLIHLILGQFGA